MTFLDRFSELREAEMQLAKMAKLLKCDIFKVADRVERLILRINELQQERDKLGGL